MTPFFVDASAALKWLSPFRSEALAPEARGLLHRWRQGAIELLAGELARDRQCSLESGAPESLFLCRR
jgi:hypothetical protein